MSQVKIIDESSAELKILSRPNLEYEQKFEDEPENLPKQLNLMVLDKVKYHLRLLENICQCHQKPLVI